jgi:hypothetical protein
MGIRCAWIPKFAKNEITQITDRGQRRHEPLRPRSLARMEDDAPAGGGGQNRPRVSGPARTATRRPGSSIRRNCSQMACVEPLNRAERRPERAQQGPSTPMRNLPRRADAAGSLVGHGGVRHSTTWWCSGCHARCRRPPPPALLRCAEAVRPRRSRTWTRAGGSSRSYDTTVSKLDCVQEFCRDRFRGIAVEHGVPTLSGCVEYICGDENPCGDSDSGAQCTEEFFMAQRRPRVLRLRVASSTAARRARSSAS